MDAIFDLIVNLLKITIAFGFITLAFKLLKIKKTGDLKAEILHQQSKLSKARMALKGKIKKKANTFRASVKTAISEGDLLDTTIKQLTDNKFETSQDFQDYFDTSRKIVSFINAGKDGKPDSNVAPEIENDFMCSDFKTEMDIIRIIKEITNLSARINTLVNHNNQVNPDSSIEKTDNLVFESLAEINRVFKDESNSQDSNSADSTNSDSSKKAS